MVKITGTLRGSQEAATLSFDSGRINGPNNATEAFRRAARVAIIEGVPGYGRVHSIKDGDFVRICSMIVFKDITSCEGYTDKDGQGFVY